MARPLRVGLNLVYLEPRSGGAGTYARDLLDAMLDVEPDVELTAFTSKEAPDWLRAAAADGKLTHVEFPVTITHGPPGNFGLVAGAQWVALPWQAARRRLDVVHGLGNVAPLLAPRVATVVTVHDLIWMRFGHTLDRAVTLGYKLTTIPSARRADRIITGADSVKRDLVETLRLDGGRIDVVPHGMREPEDVVEAVAPVVLREKLGLGDHPVVLSVGQKRVHKNQLGLIRAMAQVTDTTARLVLPGAATPYEQTLREAAAELGIADRVVFPAWLDPAELEGLYRLATCFVLPSFEEGFGLPVLEAMARGTATACSNTTSLPEVAGEAALLFDPEAPAAMAAAIDRLLGEPRLRARLIARGYERAAAFPWRAAAEGTLATYRRAIEQRRP